ncbi:trp operon leader peptide [Streptomyces sp. TRM66268-LWL]|uniref:Trp operon leader peptide n=1 Tax=Streptomyces polyasparticus TaxID=2767826 RepID=A0ABR7SB72_9ACTN|nr:trp operon leader peptide [Streptomyces polyasparticus]
MSSRTHRDTAAGECAMVGAMYTQQHQNWWWTAHPAAH